MIEPWNIRPENNRIPDTLVTFIIFCEDEVSEPLYFKFFETSKIKVNFIGGQMSKLDNINKAVTLCLKQGIMDYVDGKPILLDPDPIVWCVYDRDKDTESESQQLMGNTSFTHSLETAAARGIKVAWSNDSFELWILLHFEDVDPKDKENTRRATYYSKLTSIFENLPNKNEFLVRTLSHPNFSYKHKLKSEKNFRNIVRNQLTTKISHAIRRAKELEEFHEENIPAYEKSPCTMVHKLVEELIQFGGKEIS